MNKKLYKYLKKRVQIYDQAVDFYNWWFNVKRQRILFRPYCFVTCRCMAGHLSAVVENMRPEEYDGYFTTKYGVQIYLNDKQWSNKRWNKR